MDGLELADKLTKDGYNVKMKTKSTITILVDGNRLDAMQNLANALSSLGSKIDSSMSGSSIGGVVVGGTIKIRFKSEGKSDGLDTESAAISSLGAAIAAAMATAGGPIEIRLHNKTVKGIIGVRKTAGTPKSDFHLVNNKGDAVVHISHKDGSSPKDFQQWCGVSEPQIAGHPEVRLFAQRVNELYPGGKMPSSESVFMRIKDKKLKHMAIYGVNYMSDTTDVNRADVLIQGVPGLKKASKTIYELNATGHIHYLGEPLTGGFVPVIAMIYKGDRSQMGLRGGRASIYPFGGRSFKREIKN